MFTNCMFLNMYKRHSLIFIKETDSQDFDLFIAIHVNFCLFKISWSFNFMTSKGGDFPRITVITDHFCLLKVSVSHVHFCQSFCTRLSPSLLSILCNQRDVIGLAQIAPIDKKSMGQVYKFWNRDVIFWLKVGQIGPKGDKSGTFSEQISVHIGSVYQNVLKSDTYLGPKMITLAPNVINPGIFSDQSQNVLNLI